MNTCAFNAAKALAALCGTLAVGVADAVEPMGIREYIAVRHERPYVLSLRFQRGELNYFGIAHTRNPDGEAIRVVAQAIELAPQVVYVEGPVPEPKATLHETVQAFGEAGAAIYMARARAIRVESLDVPLAEEAASVRKKFSPALAASFYGLRALSQEGARQPGLDAEAFLRSRIVPWLVRNGILEEGTTPEQFRHVASVTSGKEQWLQELSVGWFDPLSQETVFNEVARFLVDQRDHRMVLRLADEVRKGNRVMAVAGASHVVMQERALRALLGCQPMANAEPILRSPSTGDCR